MQLGKQRGEKQKLGHVPKTHTCTSYTQSDRKGNDAWSCVSFPWTVLSWTEWEGRAVQRERKRENRGRRGEKEQTYLFISLWARDQVFISLLLHYSRVNDMGNHGIGLTLLETSAPRMSSAFQRSHDPVYVVRQTAQKGQRPALWTTATTNGETVVSVVGTCWVEAS